MPVVDPSVKFLTLSPNLLPVIVRTILTHPQFFKLVHKLMRDYHFRYWRGTFEGIKLKPAADINMTIVDVQSMANTKEIEMDKRLQLRNLMGGLEHDIKAMRKVCEDGYNRHKKTLKTLQRSVKYSKMLSFAQKFTQ